MQRVSYMIAGIGARVFIGLAVFSLSACGVSNVVIQGSFPSPNIEPLPLSVVVYYDPALTEFAHIEYSETGTEEYNIAIGQSQVEFFNSVLPAMFDEVVVVDSMEEAIARGGDAIFTPRIEEFQLALPSKTKLGVYEVWIKYNMRLETGEGVPKADWVQTSYGKTPIESLRSVERSINDAAVAGLRDLASSFSLNFGKGTEAELWLKEIIERPDPGSDGERTYRSRGFSSN